MKKQKSTDSVPNYISYIFIALMLTVFLFWLDSTGYVGITEAKLGVFRLLCGGYVILNIILIPACLLTGLMSRKELKQTLRDITLAQKLVLAYLAISIISALCSPYRAQTWVGVSRYEGLSTILIYGLSFFFLSSYGKMKKWMLYLLGAALCVFSALCIAQMAGANPFGLYPEGLSYLDAGKAYSGAYLGTIGNTDLVAAFLCIAVSILWVALVRMGDKKRFVLILPLVMALYVLFKMSVMAGLLGTFGGGAIALPVIIKADKKKRRALAIAIAVLIVLALVLLFAVDLGSGMLHEAHQLLRGNASDAFGSGRLYIWKNVLDRIPSHLWLGTGPDTMSLAGIEPFTRFDADRNVQLIAEIDAAHNEYLNILYHQGVFALIAYLATLVSLAVKWVKASQQSAECAMLGTAIAAYCVQAFFGISMFLTAPYLWISLGLLDAHREKKPIKKK